MRSASILAIAGFLAVAAAQPMEKRAEDVDWVTITKTQEFVMTIDVTSTKYIDGPVPTPEPEHHHHEPAHSAPQHHHVHHHQQHHHTHKPSPKPVTTQAPAPSPSPQTTKAAPPPVVTPESVNPSPKPSPKPKPSPQPSNPEPAGGYTYHGDMTYYTPGLGACGITSGPSDFIVAVGHHLFDKNNPPSGNPNDNALCGRKINIMHEGKTAVATIVDRCSACNDQSIDMSPGLFSSLAAMAVGRTGVEWSFQNTAGLSLD